MRRLAFGILAILCLCGAKFGGPPWPKCSVRSGVQGGPAIVIDGAPHAPLMFAGNNQFGRDNVLLEELRMAAGAGLRLFSFNVNLDWHASTEQAAQTVDRFCAAHPDGWFCVRIWLGANRTWTDAHREDCITKADGTRLAHASPSSLAWREQAASQLEKRLREILGGPHAHRFIGVVLTCLQTGEWFYPMANEFLDYSPANLRAFRAWLRKTYERNKRLQTAWNDPNVTFDTAAFPSPEARETASWGPFRDPNTQRPAIDMQRFQGELVVDTIACFARVVKEVTGGRSLVGAFYGYTMELNNNGPRALAQSGHLALARLLECDDIDMVHAPYSYFERRLGQPGHLHLPVDSVALHGKLAILEEDTFTHLAEKPGEHLIAPGWRDRTSSAAETLAITQRNFGMFLTHRCGLWVFDLLSDGRWNDRTFWNSVGLLRRMAAELRSERPFRPEVAFIVDEDSVHYLRATTHPLLLESLSRWRAELDRTGTPVGYYLQSDLPRLPDSVKVLILANAFHIDKPERRAIDKALDRGATLIWNYAPDIIGPNGIDFRRISARTGIAIEAKADNVPISIVSELSNETQTIDRQSWRPRFVVTAQDGIDVVARYRATGEVSAAARPAQRGVSLYTGTPRLPVGLLREVFRRAGVHLYHDRPGMTGVFGPYIVVHADVDLQDETVEDILADILGDKVHTFAWPQPCRSVTRLVPHRPWPIRLDNPQTWRDTLAGKTTAIYKVKVTGAR